MAGEGGVFSSIGMVNKAGEPFVKTFINEEDFGQLTVPEAYAAGIRMIQSAINAERDSGLIKHMRALDFDDTAISVMLGGIRDYREQYDPPEGLGN